jgi:sarcosine oxidase subunit beta
VICAAGAWSGQIGAMAEVDLPVTPLRRQILITEPVSNVPPDLPMTIDFGTTFYFHGEGQGLLIGMSDPDEQPGFMLHRSDAWLPRLAEAIARRAPRLESVGLASGWAGLYEMTPDHNALVGEAGVVNRLLYATGFSGHGFLMGPAIGEVMRDLYLQRQPVIDISPLSADRFERGGRPELNIV